MNLLGTSERNMHYIVPCVRINTCKKKKLSHWSLLQKEHIVLLVIVKIFGFGGTHNARILILEPEKEIRMVTYDKIM